MSDNNNIISNFLKIGAIKFGNFMMKSNVMSPIYIDLRELISYPHLLKLLAEKVWTMKNERKIDADIICGVPYTALPLATTVEILYDVPMVMRRKEIKNYGTKKILEGNFQKGQKCLIIEDVVTSGSSVLETAKILADAGLVVTDCIVILNRQQGGKENLAKYGINLHAIYELRDVLTNISETGLVSQETVEKIKNYLNETTFIESKFQNNCIKLPFSQRAISCTSSILRNLWTIMDSKKSNLCVAVDVTESSKLLHLADVLGPYICILKTHIDIIEDFNEELLQSLREISHKHNFLLMEDRKFADIGNTVKLQYGSGMYKINSWADIVTVHALPGEGIINAMKTLASDKSACVLVARMSSEGALTSEAYSTQTITLAEKHQDFVIGFISQYLISGNSNFVHMCPGISIDSHGDTLGQQYKTPENAIQRYGVDIIIVGRSIINAKDVIETAKLYRDRAYNAYVESIAK